VTNYTIVKGVEEVLHIGFDDTDHRLGKCTTHLAFKITEFLLKKTDAKFIDYPLLIRLNPNIPWKTRGNGAVCLRVKTYDQDKIIEFIKYYIEKDSAIGSGANPGVAFFKGEQIPQIVKEFSRNAMFDILSRQKAKKIAKECSIQYFTFGNGQGLVGSIAAIGCLLNGDYTFEVIAYRRPEKYGTVRKVDVNKVIEYNKNTFPYTFNNYDQIHRRILIAPHGPDPVFCGIRGESPEVVVSSLGALEIIEKLDGYMVFRSNQGTNMHLQKELKLSDLKSFIAGHIRCKVSRKPHIIQGGHTLFAVQDYIGINIPAAVYEPTGLTNIVSQLEVGDIVEIGCGVRKATSKYSKILNIEYLSIIELVDVYKFHNPLCERCGKQMKSEGRDKGFQCRRCKYREVNTTHKICIPVRRRIKAGLYIPTPKAHRHLTKPLHRYGMEKKLTDSNRNLQLLNGWFFLYEYNNSNNSAAYS
jgi:tRNA(Ile2)-agmatinylcytidine synthase